MEGPFIWKVAIWSLHISCRTGPKTEELSIDHVKISYSEYLLAYALLAHAQPFGKTRLGFRQIWGLGSPVIRSTVHETNASLTSQPHSTRELSSQKVQTSYSVDLVRWQKHFVDTLIAMGDGNFLTMRAGLLGPSRPRAWRKRKWKQG
jgi:hypothetical protein